MGYKFVDILNHLERMKGMIEKAKKEGKYVGQEVQWDKHVEAVLRTHCGVASANVAENAAMIKQRWELSKQRVNSADALLKKAELSEADFKVIELVPGIIEKYVDEMNADTQSLTQANVAYRGDWPGKSGALLKNKGVSQPYTDARKREIDVARDVINLVKRTEEYLVRSSELAKQGMQRKNKGGVEVASFEKDLVEIKGKIELGVASIQTLRDKRGKTLDDFRGWEKQKTWSPLNKSQAKNWMALMASGAKEARGVLKTLKLLYEGLEKRGKSAGAGWKERAAKAVKDAKASYAKAESLSAAFDKDEKECEKIFKKMGA